MPMYDINKIANDICKLFDKHQDKNTSEGVLFGPFYVHIDSSVGYINIKYKDSEPTPSDWVVIWNLVKQYIGELWVYEVYNESFGSDQMVIVYEDLSVHNPND